MLDSYSSPLLLLLAQHISVPPVQLLHSQTKNPVSVLELPFTSRAKENPFLFLMISHISQMGISYFSGRGWWQKRSHSLNSCFAALRGRAFFSDGQCQLKQLKMATPPVHLPHRGKQQVWWHNDTMKVMGNGDVYEKLPLCGPKCYFTGGKLEIHKTSCYLDCFFPQLKERYVFFSQYN